MSTWILAYRRIVELSQIRGFGRWRRRSPRAGRALRTASLRATAWTAGSLVAVALGTSLAVALAHGEATAQTRDAGVTLAAMSPAPVAGAVNTDSAEANSYSCPLAYDLPADVDVTLPSDDAGDAFADYSWKTFLALNAPGVGQMVSLTGDNKTQWSQWSSTDGLIECARDPGSKNCVCPNGDCFASGTKYYPDQCMAIDGYEKYRALAEVSKTDDLFLQATHGQLSNDPLIDANGNFLRFEILVSPTTQKYVVKNKFYDADVLDNLTKNLKFPCGKAAYTGGNPNSKRSGSYMIKNAWMELPHDATGIGYADSGKYHVEELLVYTPAYRNKSGIATCEKRVMGLVGQHIVHKTVKQPRWTWATFEHKRNAPNCTELPPSGDQNDAGPSTACPASVKKDFNFYARSCSADGSDPDACQSCNAAPVSNRKGCDNPSVADDVSWCLDKPPAKVDGMTMACLQVKPRKYYSSSYQMTKACNAALGKSSTWSNYRLIGTQWYNKNSNRCVTRTNVDRGTERPQVPIPGRAGENTTPYLANSSMETYVRANCMGCHGHPTVGKNEVSTDFMYWILLEAADTGDSDALAALLERSPH